MAGLCAPLSTLRRCPRGHLRMTRGRCGSLLLHRDGLAPSTPCRSPGALRIDPGKINIAPSAGDATWFRLVDVALDNPNEVYPNGDHVQTVEPWQPPETWAYLTHDMLNQMLTTIDA